MAERSQHRASKGLEGRSECPATGMGSPEPDTRASIKSEPYDTPRDDGGHQAPATNERQARRLRDRLHLGHPKADRAARLIVERIRAVLH